MRSRPSDRGKSGSVGSRITSRDGTVCVGVELCA